MGKDIDTADDRRVDLARVQRPHRLIKRHERRGTGRVDGHARTAQAEDVGNTVGDDRQGVPRHEIRSGGCRIVDRQVGVVEAGGADIDADIFTVQRGDGDIGVLERAPGELQQNPLLRVHIHGLALRHPEYGGVEIIDLVENARGKGIGLAWGAHDRVPESRHIPAVRRDACHGAFALTKNFEQRLRRFRSGCKACTPYDFNRHV